MVFTIADAFNRWPPELSVRCFRRTLQLRQLLRPAARREIRGV